jgi:hypothetical protein
MLCDDHRNQTAPRRDNKQRISFREASNRGVAANRDYRGEPDEGTTVSLGGSCTPLACAMSAAIFSSTSIGKGVSPPPHLSLDVVLMRDIA